MQRFKQILAGVTTGLINGLFGSGGGIIAVYALCHWLGVEEHKAHATAIFIILPLTVVSAAFYIYAGELDWSLLGKVVLGSIPGGIAGAFILKSCPKSILHKIFGAFMVAAAIKLLL